MSASSKTMGSSSNASEATTAATPLTVEPLSDRLMVIRSAVENHGLGSGEGGSWTRVLLVAVHANLEVLGHLL